MGGVKAASPCRGNRGEEGNLEGKKVKTVEVRAVGLPVGSTGSELTFSEFQGTSTQRLIKRPTCRQN